MTIPDYQGFMLPLLNEIADGQEITSQKLYSSLADGANLTSQEREELLPSGSQRVYQNRIGWAAFYLKKAGLLESPGRGRYKLTVEGAEFLSTNPTQLGTDSLRQYPSFREFQENSRNNVGQVNDVDKSAQTPIELIDQATAFYLN
ncbi:MAG: winged helix-turn-helix domain-containing protein [Kangiellaceae bacterium]|jgi:restriction system protein|nr:winged helix-turn-helix domain-containing protein [Kangiellaceae bacterium]